MKVKVFYPDPDGSIRFSKQELQALLDEVYKEGYNDARPYYWSTPNWTYTNNPNTITTPYTYLNTSATTITSSNHDNCPSYGGTTLTMSAPEPEDYKVEFKSA